jgi:protease-4
MKNFLTSMLGALAALFIFGCIGLLLFIGLLGAIVSLGSKRVATAATSVESGSYLVVDLSTNVTDAPPRFDFSAFGGDREQTLQLRSVTRALKTAARDPNIAGVLLEGTLDPAGYGSGYAALREVRTALEGFRRAGKPVKAYLEFADTKDYFLASAANEITLDPYGVIFLPGLATESAYYAGAFEKFGIGVQVTRVGKYKSYVEPFIRRDMSPADREQTQKLLDDVWGSLLADIGRDRGLKPAAIQSVVDSQGLIRADLAKSSKLVDKVAYRDQLDDELKSETGKSESGDSFKQVTLAAYLRTKPDLMVQRSGDGQKIAVVYAEGEIVDGKGDYGEVGAQSYADEIRKLREDDDVKAIVLRVNSPGGSVSASEDIQRELRLAEKAKPVIVSMGSYAASGGYWISAYGDRIFAEPTTITGSIGVFGIQFDVQKLMNDTLGITFDGVKTGKFADALTITRPKTPEELAVLQGLVDWTYDQFITKVSEARKIPRARVEDLAQGRVWSGREALRLGLVDQIGSLDNAIAYAASKAGVAGSFRLVEYPGKKDLAQEISDLLGRVGPASGMGSGGIAGEVERRIQSELAQLRAFNDPQGLYALMPIDLAIK